MEIFKNNSLSIEDLLSIMPIYFKEINADYNDLKGLLDSNDTEQFRLLIHKMKGTSRTYGVDPIVRCIEKVEAIFLGNHEGHLNDEVSILGSTIEHVISEIKTKYNLVIDN